MKYDIYIILKVTTQCLNKKEQNDNHINIVTLMYMANNSLYYLYSYFKHTFTFIVS